ncbi:hypothetical protein CK203_096856 [Vitis vinifera]|uniref:Uncharacterized protein n=1 Tax=Vitis vinifera TaxID=29760 RepID=A0A438BPS0_VITVI|nr:hypothetical protein CK203_096856 [Vitis vinifera]
MQQLKDEGGCIMFEVLLVPLEVVVEGLEVSECLGWEAVIMDKCQHPIISSHLGGYKMLVADLRLLLFSDQIKESTLEFVNLLSFHDFNNDHRMNREYLDSSYMDSPRFRKASRGQTGPLMEDNFDLNGDNSIRYFISTDSWIENSGNEDSADDENIDMHEQK